MGAAFGLLRGLVLVLAMVFVVNMTPLKADGWWQQSVGVPLLNAALRGLQPLLDSIGVSSRWPAVYSPGKSP
jgi:membrane protein required for colicin V production